MLCKKPIYIKSAAGLTPCGQCLPCRINRVQKWTCRLQLEQMAHERSCWLTFTYNDEHLPKTYFDKTDGNIYEGRLGTLAPKHITDYIKRLRFKLPMKVRFFYCGEYGDEAYRPHYHMCLFGAGEEWAHVIKECWTYKKQSLGFVEVRPLVPENIRYTCGYAVKKLTKKTDERLDGRYPEFMRCSQGIGKETIDKIAEALKTKSGRTYYEVVRDIPRVYTINGKDYPLDRYVVGRILKSLEKEEENAELRKKIFAEKMSDMRGRARLIAPNSAPSEALMLEKQYAIDNAQKLLNADGRLEIFLSQKEKKL